MGVTSLFEALNQLLCKMIHSFEALEPAHASDSSWLKLHQNMHKNSFYKPIANVLLYQMQ